MNKNTKKLDRNKNIAKEKLTKILDIILKNNNINLNDIKLFGQNKQGYSGARIGFIKHKNKNCIIKLNKKPKNLSYKTKGNCIYLHYAINELFITYIINNIHLFTNSQKLKKIQLDNYIVKNYSIGVLDNDVYTISEKIGIQQGNNYNTNLDDLFRNNFIPYIKNLNEKDYQKNLNKLLVFLTQKLKTYFDIMKILNTTIGFVHSDLKLENVFIKQTNEKSNPDFISNVNLLVSDLDKSNIRLNNVKILPDTSLGTISKALIKRSRIKYTHNFRYECLNDPNFCHNFKEYHFDRLCVLINIYIILYNKIYINKKTEKLVLELEILNNFARKYLNLTKDEFLIFLKCINNIITKNFKFRMTYINLIIYNLCKQLHKRKN